jgi:hypothetical protein
MKKIIYIAIAGLLATTFANAQFFQATYKIDDVSNPKKLSVFIRPSGGNIENIVWDRFEFFFRIPRTTNLPIFGDVATNQTNFPSMNITKGGLGADFINGYDSEPGKTNYYFPTSVPNAATTIARTFNNEQEYEVFTVNYTGDISDLEFIADQVDQFPYYITLSRTAVPSNMTASGPFAPPGAHTFYGGTLTKEGNIFIMRGGLLPVDFKSFYALKTGEDARLTWQVENDLDNKHFEIMRSLDGRNFKAIETLKALNNGRSANSYETMDFGITKLGSREVFYQIKQVDKDGTITNSPIRKLSVDGLGKAVSAFPNPAKNTTKVKVEASEAGHGNLIMRDGMGRQVRLVNTQFHRGINLFDMNIMGLASGEYTIQVNGGGVNETIKLTKIQ